jgi:hypothetical protein
MAKAISNDEFRTGLDLYERANDARQRGDHEGYAALVNELIAYNAARASASSLKGAA